MQNPGSIWNRHVERCRMLEAWAVHDFAAYRAFTETIERHSGRKLSALRVLDLGCGANAPTTVLLHAKGTHVTGVDSYLGYRWGLGFRPSRYMSYLNEAGLARTCRKVLGELCYDRRYYGALSRAAGVKLTEARLDLRQVDIQALDLSGESFDVVHSNATWEHIRDVPAANRAVARALRPGGIAYIEIHLFPSLSGGHDLPWIVPGRTVLGAVQPWRHLLDPEWQAPVYLNRLRERDYRAAFEGEPALEILDWQTEFTEGRDLLTADIERQLTGYSREELTKRSIVVVAQRRLT